LQLIVSTIITSRVIKREQKKFRVLERGTFLFEKTGCLLDLLRKQSAKHTQNRALMGINSCSNFFATPTRLADGLGTKDYPRGLSTHRFAPVS
jgi:hypothetical protein